MRLIFAKLTLIALVCLNCPKVFAAKNACVTAEVNFSSRFENLQQDYRKYDSNANFSKSNQPYWKTGTRKKIAYLLKHLQYKAMLNEFFTQRGLFFANRHR